MALNALPWPLFSGESFVPIVLFMFYTLFVWDGLSSSNSSYFTSIYQVRREVVLDSA